MAEDTHSLMKRLMYRISREVTVRLNEEAYLQGKFRKVK